MYDLAGRVAVVTGGASGIGKATAIRLAHEGAKVAVIDIDREGAELVASAIRSAGGYAAAFASDVSRSDSVEVAFAGVLDGFDRVDILVNNAGLVGRNAPLHEISDAEWRALFAVDLDGTFYWCRAVVPSMIAQKSGRIINVASVAGKEGNANSAAYSAAKAGQIALTKALAKELVQFGIIVNCITPGSVRTKMTDDVPPDRLEKLLDKMPMHRIADASEVAAQVAWLCSDECTFSTGATFDMSGGRATY